jgi:hypothetical protein
MSTDADAQPKMSETFQKKYEEFAADLAASFPELEAAIKAALAIPATERMTAYRTTVFTASRAASKKDMEKSPGLLLPGVEMPIALWETAGKRTKAAVVEYISVLNLAVAFSVMEDGSEGAAEFTKDWMENLMRQARASMDKIDFENISKTFFKAFGGDASGALPPLPEKFLKGKLAKLAEDMVREFKPEDFGITAEEIEACERDPTRAFEILMKASMTNPNMIASAMTRIQKKLEGKVARGELKPQELMAEAEELIQEFQNHPAFVDLMKTFKEAFNGDDDMDFAKATGRENEGRLNAVRARLRKKMEAKKAGVGGAANKKK